MSKKENKGKGSTHVKRKRNVAEAKADKAAVNAKRKATIAKQQEPRSHEREHEFH
jgi:hypothetical protein